MIFFTRYRLRIRSRYGPEDYGDLMDCRVVVIAAGATIVPGETRLQVLQRNVAVFEQVVPSILQYASDTILVVVSNPVDIMTHLAAHFAAGSGMPSTRVIGSARG
jgi:L-lactate dehydrogenase